MTKNNLQEITMSFEINKLAQKTFEKIIESESAFEETQNFEILNKLLNYEGILKDRQKTQYFLHLISAISKNHHRSANFFNKIEHILFEIINSLAIFFLNIEIFHIFSKDKRILLFLIEQKIIFINRYIVDIMKMKKYFNFHYLNYFYPEIKDFLQPEEIKEIQGQQNAIENFNEKRKTIENDDNICQ